MDVDYDGTYDWVAQPVAQFPARTGVDDAHDCPVFIAHPNVVGRDPANAITRLNCFGEQW